MQEKSEKCIKEHSIWQKITYLYTCIQFKVIFPLSSMEDTSLPLAILKYKVQVCNTMKNDGIDIFSSSIQFFTICLLYIRGNSKNLSHGKLSKLSINVKKYSASLCIQKCNTIHYDYIFSIHIMHGLRTPNEAFFHRNP